MVDEHLAIGGPYFVAPVDTFQAFSSYYGTLQQGGNVWEWVEDWQYGIIGSRALRGGSWSYTSYGLNACNTDPGALDNSGYVFGARLCMAVSNDGWSFVGTPIMERIYEYIMLLPLKHLILYLALGCVLSAFGGFFLILSFVVCLKRFTFCKK